MLGSVVSFFFFGGGGGVNMFIQVYPIRVEVPKKLYTLQSTKLQNDDTKPKYLTIGPSGPLLYPKGPCTQLWAQCIHIGSTLRPMYILFRYMDP